jgi:hypothetical protein
LTQITKNVNVIQASFLQKLIQFVNAIPVYLESLNLLLKNAYAKMVISKTLKRFANLATQNAKHAKEKLKKTVYLVLLSNTDKSKISNAIAMLL